MKLRSLVATVGIGAVGAVVNESLAKSGGRLEPSVVGEQSTYRWRGMDIEYTTAGPEDAPTVVCLHDPDIVGSGYEFRKLAAELTDEYRVVVPDLPGYGRSDRPPLRYSANLYRTFIDSFLKTVTDNPIVIASGLSGNYVLAIADDLELTEIVAICPRTEHEVSSEVEHAVLRSPVLGTGIYNALASKTGITGEFGEAFYGPLPEDKEWTQYHWQAAHQEGARFAPAARLSGYLHPDTDLAESITESSIPTTLLWGREALAPPLADGRSLAKQTDTRLIVIDYARTRPHVEYPTVVGKTLRDQLLESVNISH